MAESEFLFYAIEEELKVLRLFRMKQAAILGQIAMKINALEDLPNASLFSLFQNKRKTQRLWKDFFEQKTKYEASHSAVLAYENHHMESGILSEMQKIISSKDADRRERERSKFTDPVELTTTEQILESIRYELRAMRDVVDPPTPKGLDAENIRRSLMKDHGDFERELNRYKAAKDIKDTELDVSVRPGRQRGSEIDFP